ncbi:MAG: alpha-galactosidase [Planctomycetes bacterium]|nr:alpha-galactosidase [Planctomycetota bacterium]
MKLAWTVRPDGSFDVNAGPLSVVNCYPAIDGLAVRAMSVHIDRREDFIEVTYRLAEGAMTLQFGQDGETLSLGCLLRGMKRAPFFVQPLAGQVLGAAKFFRQGLGFSGPSGFVELAGLKDFWSHESYLVSALTAADRSTLAIAARDHRDFLQRTTLFNRQWRRGLINRHLEREYFILEAGFSTENIPIDSGQLELPNLYLQDAETPWDAMHSTAGRIAVEMKARTHNPPCYHYCSWYDRGPSFGYADLMELLDGLDKINPHIPIQAIQIDAGYCPWLGDWLEPREIWPGGMEAAFKEITRRGYKAGVWVGPFMVANRGRLYKEHPDWVIRDHEGRPEPLWTKYHAQGIPGHTEEETYALDASHPDAVEYLRKVFRTLRQWGATFYKTDFMDWGLKDTAKIRRHDLSKTSVQHYRRVLQIIRDEIDPDSYWLACIAPYAPFLGFADGARIANDLGPTWSEGSTGNMINESYIGQYFNNVWWQNDPDVTYLRDRYVELADPQIRALALWEGILGCSVNTSDMFHKLPPDRLALWRFLQPADEHNTARLPFWGDGSKLLVAVRRYEQLDSWAVYILNPTADNCTASYSLSDLIGLREADVFEWGPDNRKPIGRQRDDITVRLAGRSGSLFYISSAGTAPPENLTLGGRLIP